MSIDVTRLRLAADAWGRVAKNTKMAEILNGAADEIDRLRAERDALRALLTDLDASVAFCLTGIEHEHDAKSPLGCAIARHRARDGAPCATCNETGWRTTIHDGINVNGGAELAVQCPACGGSGVAS